MAAQAKTLAEAVVAAQAELPAIERDAVNPHFKSRYMTLDNLLAKALPVLNRHGLALLQQPTSLDGRPALKTTLLHESGERAEEVTPLVFEKGTPQAYGSALTYFRRYCAAALLGISDQGDDDGNGAERPARADGRPATRARAPQQTEEWASPAQRRMIFAKAKECGLTEDELKNALKSVAGTAHSDRLPKAKVDQVLAFIEDVAPVVAS